MKSYPFHLSPTSCIRVLHREHYSILPQNLCLCLSPFGSCSEVLLVGLLCLFFHHRRLKIDDIIKSTPFCLLQVSIMPLSRLTVPPKQGKKLGNVIQTRDRPPLYKKEETRLIINQEVTGEW